MKKNMKGIALIAVVMLFTIVAITVGGIASFVANNLALSATRASEELAMYAAQAGVYAAIEASRYHFNDWRKMRDVNLGAGVSYSYGKDANFMYITADAPRLVNMFTSGPPGPGNFGVVERIIFWNNSYETITADKLKVEWYNIDDPAFVLRELRFNTSRDVGRVSSGTIIDLDPPLTMQPNSGVSDAQFFFSKSVPTNIILIATFYFADGSSRKAILLNNSRSGNNEVSITSTGKVGTSPGYKRTIEATYDNRVNMITSWQEVETHI